MSLSLASVVTLISAAICLPAAYAFARLEFPGAQPAVLLVPRRARLPEVRPAGRHRRRSSCNLAPDRHVLGRGADPAGRHAAVHDLDPGRGLPVGGPPHGGGGARRRRLGRLRVFWSITLPQAGPTIAAAVLLSFVGTFYETEGAWLIGAPAIRTHAGADDLVHQQPAGDPVRRRAVGASVGAVLRRAALRAARHRVGQLRAGVRRVEHGGSRPQGRHQGVRRRPMAVERLQPDGRRTANWSACSGPRARASRRCCA